MESFSGIRGIYGDELTEETARTYASVYSNFIRAKEEKQKKKEEKINEKELREKKKSNTDKTSNKIAQNITIVIGRDTRPSGPELNTILIKNSNCDIIIDVGVLPTAAIEFAVRYFNADGGIIITASHNEPNYNGFKLLDKHGAVLEPEDISQIINDVHKIKNQSTNKENKNKKEEEKTSKSAKLSTKSLEETNKSIKNSHAEALNAYCSFVESLLTKEEKRALKEKKLKIVIDPNGGTGIISKKIFDSLGVSAVYVNMNEGEFNRKVEPTKDSLLPLLKQIKNNNATFAAGFDCDADRVELILPDGELVSGNKTLALIAKLVLSEKQSKYSPTIVVNDATSYVVKEVILSYNATWKEVEVGEVNVVNKMLNSNACLGGEGSNGGIIIPPSRCRDGIITLIYLFKAMIKENKNLSELLSELPSYFYTSKKLSLTQDFVLQRNSIKKHYSSKGFQILETGDETGGLKALKEGSWVWFRQSKTEDKVLRIVVDTKHKSEEEKLMNEAVSLVK